METQGIKKQLSRRFTVMLIPHSDFKPLRLNISFSFLILLTLSWTGLTVWSGYIASRHVDYWREKADEQVLRAKVWYFAQELNKSREYLDKVKETELALINLLNMKTRKNIIESDSAVGGAAVTDQKILSRLMAGRNVQIQDVSYQLASVQRDSNNLLSNFQAITEYIKDEHNLFRATPRAMPVEGRLTSFFGVRHSPMDETEERAEFHRGIDIANNVGTPVCATADGVVRMASWQGGYGRLVIVEHGHGYRTYYAHNSELLVKPGDVVKRGQTVAYMGTSGRSTGYHCHYEVWKDGRAVNPMQYVKATE